MSPSKPRIWLLAAVFVLTLPAVTTRLYASDEIQYFAFLRSLWFDQDLSFDNEYRYLDARGVAARSGFRETFLEATTPTGLRPTFGTIGCALLWAPFYALGDVTARSARGLGYPVEVNGYSMPYVAAVCYGSAFYGFCALLLGLAIAREVLGESPVAATFVVWFGTPLLFYMDVAPVMAHACAAFAVALFIWAWLRARGRWQPGDVAWLGAAAALMAMVREQDVVFVVGPAADFLWTLVRPKAKGLRPKEVILVTLAAVFSFAVVYLPQALSYVVLNGRLGPSNLVTRKMDWTAPHALEVVFSPSHGLVFWTPVVAVGLVGLVVLAVRRGPPAAAWHPDHRVIAACALVMIAALVYINGSILSWTVAGAFGQRRFVSLAALLVLGLAALLTLKRSWPVVARGALAVALAICVWWNVALMVAFGAHRMDRQRLHLRHDIRTVFVALPREVPSLVWRYLTDRASFYNTSRLR